MSVELQTSVREEPPGRGSEYAIEQVLLSSDPIARKNSTRQYARFIVGAYRERGVPTAEIEELTPEKERRALEGIMEAQHLLVAREHGEVVGILAYSILDRQSHPGVFERLDIMPAHINSRHESAKRIKQALTEIDGVFVTNEMIVAKEKRGNGVSHILREKAFESLKGQNVAVVGEILSRSSVEQRLKLPGPTVWAGECLNPEEIPGHLIEHELKQISHIIGRAYVATFHPHTLDTHDSDGIFRSEMFEVPARPATEPVRNSIRTALQKIIYRQAQAQRDTIYSAMAVTLCAL